jgi:hypothetical protein
MTGYHLLRTAGCVSLAVCYAISRSTRTSKRVGNGSHTECLLSSGPLDRGEFLRNLLFEILLSVDCAIIVIIRIAMMAFLITGLRSGSCYWPKPSSDATWENKKVKKNKHELVTELIAYFAAHDDDLRSQTDRTAHRQSASPSLSRN